MNAGFMKRFVAYMIDLFIISFLFSLITMNYSNRKLEDYNKEFNQRMNDYVNGEISTEEYLECYESFIYHREKNLVVTNCTYLVLCIGYFVVFQYLNKGQTIGKKLLHIKVVGRNGRDVKLKEMVIRTCMIHEILPHILSLILVLMSSKRLFFLGYSMINGVFNLFVLISAVMVMYMSDGRGLHDRMAGTFVISEDEE